MNRYFAVSLLALAAAAASPAFAGEITTDDTPFASTSTRADVKAELAAFRQAGVNPWSQEYDPLQAFASRTTRAQVTSEYLRSRDEVKAFTSEDSGSFALSRRSPGTAAQVLAGQPVNPQ